MSSANSTELANWLAIAAAEQGGPFFSKMLQAAVNGALTEAQLSAVRRARERAARAARLHDPLAVVPTKRPYRKAIAA